MKSIAFFKGNCYIVLALNNLSCLARHLNRDGLFHFNEVLSLTLQ